MKPHQSPSTLVLALHFGEAAYGNVGSGQRLDYTVIGRDVNLAARIAGMCGPLDQRLLLSTTFRNHLDEENIRSTGQHELKGLPESEEIFAAQTG